ncbi:hypothetical protein FOL46_006478 [Perkinsus olseni]|uniref:Uncharacterized protein n=1 Tax=Perkinsus olseni TaxID=32597 RepID=A0A7J6MQ92_PEROL|nr:hypothetical protein FOL46_006478 [Perkinsus olseni]
MRILLLSYWLLIRTSTLRLTRQKVNGAFGQVKVEPPFKHGSPPIHYAGQPNPHCSLSYSSGGSYKTVWFIVLGNKVHPLAWRCPPNHLIGNISNVDGIAAPKGEYADAFEECKAGVKEYSKFFHIKKLFRKERALVIAICKHR